MYDELIKNLRHDSASALQNCEFDFVHDWMLKAADAIEELVKENESLAADLEDSNERRKKKRKPQWIPVTEQLPEDRKMVLATVNGIVRVAFYGNYMWEEVETYSIFYPTHWMPIPQPPESEGK